MNAPEFYVFQPDLGGLLSLVITVLLPLAVSLITKRSQPAAMKAVLLLLFAAISTFLQAWVAALQAGAPFVWTVVAYNVVVNFVLAVAVHFGLWRPTGATDTAQDALVNDKRPAYARR